MAITLSKPTGLWHVPQTDPDWAESLLVCLSATPVTGWQEAGKEMFEGSAFLRLSGATSEDCSAVAAKSVLTFTGKPAAEDYGVLTDHEGNTPHCFHFGTGAGNCTSADNTHSISRNGMTNNSNTVAIKFAERVSALNVGLSAEKTADSEVTLTYWKPCYASNNVNIMWTTGAFTDNNPDGDTWYFHGGEPAKISKFVITVDIGNSDNFYSSHPIYHTNIDTLSLVLGQEPGDGIGTDPDDITDDGSGFETGMQFQVDNIDTDYYINLNNTDPSEAFEWGPYTAGHMSELDYLALQIFTFSCDDTSVGCISNPDNTHASALYTLENGDFVNGDTNDLIATGTGFSDLPVQDDQDSSETPGALVMGDPHVSTFFGDKYDL